MSLVKTVGLVAVALVTTMAIFGAASAVAGTTQLCNQDPGGANPCPAGSAVSHVHLIDTLALLLAKDPFGAKRRILCEVLVLGYVLQLASPLIIHSEFTYSGPHGSGGPCIVEETEEECGAVAEINSGSLLRVLRTGTEKGTATVESFEILIECAGMHCVYDATGLGYTVSGALNGNHGSFSITNQTLTKVSGLLCPPTTELTEQLVPLSSESILELVLELELVYKLKLVSKSILGAKYLGT